MKNMKIGFIIYDGLTALDFVGVHDPVTRLKTMGFVSDLSWEICALESTVTATGGVTLNASATGGTLNSFDTIIVPGCVDIEETLANEELIDWIATGSGCRLIATVCTGSVLCGAAGLLDGARATTHPMAYDDLSKYCEVSEQRVVDDGSVISARGVTSAIDLGLYFCERVTDEQTRKSIAKQMDYPHYSSSIKDKD